MTATKHNTEIDTNVHNRLISGCGIRRWLCCVSLCVVCRRVVLCVNRAASLAQSVAG
jgi:hypothetical protein